MLRGVRRTPIGAYTHSIIMRSKTGTVRFVESYHNFERKTDWSALVGK
jgi:fructose-1,6-bisphosphatase II / sedoheptulose-1,7-bisphosphatase